MKYCNNCIMPDTRPDQIFNDSGICNACLSHQNSDKIDWTKREVELKRNYRRHKKKKF